ncbi:MAG: DUF2975 domain-containing protein [Pseudomonadota bacterium]
MTDAPPSGRFAALLAQATLIGAVLLPLMAAGIWLFWDRLAGLAAGDVAQAYDATGLGAPARLAGFALSLAGALVQAYGLLGVRRTFLEAAAGRTFSARSVGGFRRFAWVSLAMVFIGIVQRAGLVAILSMSDPSKPNALSIQFGSNDVKALFMGLLLVFVAHVFSEGKRAKDENETFL